MGVNSRLLSSFFFAAWNCALVGAVVVSESDAGTEGKRSWGGSSVSSFVRRRRLSGWLGCTARAEDDSAAGCENLRR